MGLDAEIRSRPKSNPKAEPECLAYYRKFNALQGFFEELGCENCKELTITEEILDKLEQACIDKTLTPTEGFFYGSQEPVADEDYQELLESIAVWRNLLAEFDLVYWCSY